MQEGGDSYNKLIKNRILCLDDRKIWKRTQNKQPQNQNQENQPETDRVGQQEAIFKLLHQAHWKQLSLKSPVTNSGRHFKIPTPAIL